VRYRARSRRLSVLALLLVLVAPVLAGCLRAR